MSAMFDRTFGRQIRIAAYAAAAFATAQSFATPASAGLLDFLFGTSRPQPVAVEPPPVAKPARPRVVHDEPRGPRPYVAPEVVPGPLGRFLRDPSLRRGDVVATPNGLMIFQGRAGSNNHKPSDFVPVASAGGVAGARRSELLNLDRTVRAVTPNVEFAVETQSKPMQIAKRPDGGAEFTAAKDGQARAERVVATQ
ncbi:MAG: hypothetical protein ACK4MV_09815 [Beijerinckiaceae bacterium]